MLYKNKKKLNQYVYFTMKAKMLKMKQKEK